MSSPENAQDFIRALKASSDPPQPGGPSKIEIAREAWDSSALYVPNKAEAILDWLLSRLLKDKSRERSESPLCDARYWKLLSDVLPHSNAMKDGTHNRTFRAWLLPLLNRIPIAPIFLAYFGLLTASDHVDVNQFTFVSRCISVLWPLAAPKFNPETLLECFGAVIQLSVSHAVPDLSCGRLHALSNLRALSVIVSSYRTSLANSGAKRKQLYTLFLKKHITCWLRLSSRSCECENEVVILLSDIYDAGIETIFGLEILKQAADFKHIGPLSEAFEAALSDSPGIVLRSIPRLFTSYVRSIKRHKSALFGQGSSQAQGQIIDLVQRAAMTFYAMCDSLTLAVTDDSSWQCRVSLLEVVEAENLLSPKDEDAKAVLRQGGNQAVEALAGAQDDSHAQRTDGAVQMLATLTRIDHDLVYASFAVVLPRLVAVPPQVSSALRYLTLLLEYDSKTRNLPSSIIQIAGAFSVRHLERIPGGPWTSYKIVSAGPLTSLSFLDELSRSVQNFLTPGQVLDTIRDVSRNLQNAYERFVESEVDLSDDRSDGPRKKRKKDAPQDRSEAEYHAVSFVLMARVLAVVLQALPLHTVTGEVRSEAERLIGEMYSAVACRAIVDGLQRPERRQLRSWQLVVIGALRIHHGLARASRMHLPLQPPLGNELVPIMLSCVTSEDTIPELVVEMLHTSLHRCSLGAADPEAVVQGLLGYLNTNIVGNNTIWSGKAHCLDTHAAGGTATLHLLADRWLPYFEEWASPTHCERLASILVNVNRELPSLLPSGMNTHSIVRRMLHDAQFWELLKLREAFLAQLQEQTVPLTRLELPTLLTNLSSHSSPLSLVDLRRTVSAYDMLLLTPPEYLPRAMHMECLKRGFVADVVVLSTLRYAKKKVPVFERHLWVVREVLRRSIAYLGMAEFATTKEYLHYLLEHTVLDGDAANQALLSITKQLIDMYQGSLIRSAKNGDAEVLTVLIQRYAHSYLDEVPTLARETTLLLINNVVQNTSLTDFPVGLIDELRELYKRVFDYSVPRLNLDRATPLDSLLLDTWYHARVLARWLKMDGEQVPMIGRELARNLLSWIGEVKQVATLAPVVVAILLEELRGCDPHDRRANVEHVVITYVSLFRICGRDGMGDVEVRLSGTCRTLSTETFTMILDLVCDGLPLHSGLPSQDINSLIRLSISVLRDPPEGTSKTSQAHTTRCLNLFAGDAQFTTSSLLRGEVLNFLVRQCNDRPVALRTVDLSSLWSILHALLTGSPEHDQITDPTIFHGIVDVLSALVRLRRDLVLNTLPHLGFVLRQLTFCLRGLRPQLGGKQSQLVLDTLPRWISPTQPLSAAEGKALARLLTTLMTKTLVRVHGGVAETQKPESLARPFSKHAAGVIAAHVEAVNDPLCVVSAGIRKELQPGLFALCDMLGEHNRDAMMVSALDAGGKATMKMLWKEYEKQRYVGKG